MALLASPKNLSTEQIDQLYDTLFPDDGVKLKGRPVFIPFTNQAFVLGDLDPATNEKGEEQVQIVGDRNQIQTVSITEAKTWLEKHSSPLQNKSKTCEAKDDDTAVATHNALVSSSRFVGGFVEIQEEFNADGKQVRGDVVDVSKRLNAIWQNTMEPALSHKVDDGGGPIIEEEEEEPHKNPMSDEEYEKLSKRLYELARMEEEAERGGATPSAKPKELSSKNAANSSGWKKGFLSSKPTKSKKTKASQQRTIPRPGVDTYGLSKEITQASNSVSFDTTQNQIQEIPRIGTQKVPPKPCTVVGSKPLETCLFSGVVQERPSIQKTPVIQERSVIRESLVVQEGVEQQKTQKQPKKRLSRFARERQQHMQ